MASGNCRTATPSTPTSCMRTRPPRSSRMRCTSLACAKWLASKVRCEQFSMQTALQVSRSARRWTSSRKDPRFLYSNDDKGRADALARYTELIRQATERSSKELVSHYAAREDRSAPRSGVQGSNCAGSVLRHRRHGWQPARDFLREPARHERSAQMEHADTRIS